MDKKFIDLRYPKLFGGVGKYTATSKACNDIAGMLRDSGFQAIPVSRHFSSKCGALEILFWFQRHRFELKRDDAVFIQYPMVNYAVFRHCYRIAARSKVVAVIHDLPSFRFGNQSCYRSLEIRMLNSFACLIVHTEQMKSVLRANGVKTPMEVLHVFDYLLDGKTESKHKRDVIVFAGALQKSSFLRKMDVMPLRNDYHLYGSHNPGVSNKSLHYMGKFPPDDISIVEGEWGLLWDGDSVESCQGDFGEYLRIIAPHKMSLYIACKLKIIAWEGSAMADYVVRNNIGFTIGHISEIGDRLENLPEQDRAAMQGNVEKLSTRLRAGCMFRTVLGNIMNTL